MIFFEKIFFEKIKGIILHSYLGIIIGIMSTRVALILVMWDLQVVLHVFFLVVR